MFIGVGKKDGIRPGDLVGAIANETHLVGAQIGPIKVGDKFSTVGVPKEDVDSVITALKQTTFKGNRATIRPFSQDAADDRPARFTPQRPTTRSTAISRRPR